MSKPSITSAASTNNVRFYSSTATMGTYTDNNSRLCQGPKRVICFCLLAVITPSLFISTVLLMRFVFNGTATYHIHPSDMRILDHRISTTWCQSERIKMNTTFTAYLTSGEPHLIKAPAPLTTTKTLIIPDDHKEYWGFYLLKGSTFRIRTCARYKGGTLLIVRGRSHLEHCAYIGQADSAGDSDEFSNSGSLESQNDDGSGHHKNGSQRSAFNLLGQKGSSAEEMSLILSKIRSYIRSRPKGYTRLKENLVDWMVINSKINFTQQNDHHEDEQKQQQQEQEQHHQRFDHNETTASANNNSTENHLSSKVEEVNTTRSNNSFESNHPHKIRHENSRRHHNQHNHNLHGGGELEESTADQKNGRRKKRSVVTSNEDSLKSMEHGTIRKSRRNVDIRKNTESGENGAFEDSSEVSPDNNVEDNNYDNFSEISATGSNLSSNVVPTKLFSKSMSQDTPNSVWKNEHSHHTGTLDDTNPNQEFDGSDSESESSFSSSEEALARCEGVVASLYLKPTEGCGDEDDHVIPLFYENTVNVSGYYYFIFGSENEKRDNFIRSRFELEKYVYDLPPPLDECVHVTECHVNLTFWSNQKMVVQIPQPSPQEESIWDEVYHAESQCEPRMLLYLIFVVVVPVSIIMCAFQ